MDVRAILDTGSQWSFVTQRVKDTLDLTPYNQQMLSVLAFGTSNSKGKNCEVVKI